MSPAINGVIILLGLKFLKVTTLAPCIKVGSLPKGGLGVYFNRHRCCILIAHQHLSQFFDAIVCILLPPSDERSEQPSHASRNSLPKCTTRCNSSSAAGEISLFLPHSQPLSPAETFPTLLEAYLFKVGELTLWNTHFAICVPESTRYSKSCNVLDHFTSDQQFGSNELVK
jgi:hypothetical protein